MQVLSNPSIVNIFKEILKSRILSRYQLEIQDKYDKAELEQALSSLQEKGLIDKKSAQIEEWDKYYPTDKGLAFEKIVK